MSNRYNLSNVEAKFKNYLLAVNGSDSSYSDSLQSKTIKNYLSDLRHFSGWMTVKDPTRDITSQIDESDVLDYRTYLEKNSVPVATINRRLSTLRKYFTFCISQQWMTVNPGKQVSNHVSVTEKTSLAMPDTGDQALEAYTSFLKENYDANLLNEHRKVLEELLIISSN